MVCVTDEESVVCCVHNETVDAVADEDPLCRPILANPARITIRTTDTVAHLLNEISKAFGLERNAFQLYMQHRSGTDLVTMPVTNTSEQLLKDVGVVFEKNASNSFIIREVVSADGYNGVCAATNGTDDLLYREGDELLLGASASPTAIEGPQSLVAPAADDPLLISVLLRQDTVPYVGLVNQAMTCYLNSLLQALYMTPEFRNALYNWVFDGYQPDKSIPYQLQKLFLNLQTSKKSAVETTELTKSFGWDMSEAWQQHDVQELCRVMFDALEQKFKDTDQADLINRLYQGTMTDYVKCLECRTEKSRQDTFLDIPLPVRPFGSAVAYSSVEEALRAFVQPETLDGNNQYFCDKCAKKCDAHKGLKFSNIPYLLTLHLKRFDFDYTTMHRIKLNDKVVFPETLDLNSFVSAVDGEEYPVSVSAAEETSATKCDDSSTTDSGSALDDETDTSATVGANATAVAEYPEDDEGIDMSSGATNMHENEKNRRHNEPKGPYVYELFSIMIHSGSASGGHYYAYIKDFRKGKWFCFDDQTVTTITYDDIQKTYGGGPMKSYYSGAYSSSTNAYMLMYRQVDPERNVQAMTTDEFPSHIKKLLQSLREREETDRMIKEREMEMYKLRLYVNHPTQGHLVESKLYLHSDTTLAEATQEAYKRSKLEDVVPLEQCRLVSYNHLQNAIECSFEGREEEAICDVITSLRCTFKLDWLLEIRAKDAHFLEYKPGGVNLHVFAVDVETEDVSGPVVVRSHETQTTREFRALLAKTLDMDEQSMQIALENCTSGRCESVVVGGLADDLIGPSLVGSKRKVYVTKVPNDDTDKALVVAKFHKIIDKLENVLSLEVILPVNDKWTLEVLSIPSLDVNQNCCEKTEIGAGEPGSLSTGSLSTGSLSTLAVHLSPRTVRVSPVQAPPPPPPPPPGHTIPEPEDTATAHSDQSNSEDSSLSDSDRTLMGDAPDECLGQLSSASASPAASDQQLSSPEDPHTVYLEENWDDETDPASRRCLHYYFKGTVVPSEPNEHVGSTLKVLVDKRINVLQLKKELEPFVGVPVEYFKVFRQCSTQEIECSRLTETLKLAKDGEKLIVKLGRVLKDDEQPGKVYQLILNAAEPIRFLCDWVIARGATVAAVKRELLASIKKQYQIDIPFNRCRLRKKNWKSPNKVYLDEQRFMDDIPIHGNWEMFLQELTAPEVVTNVKQTVFFVRHWCPETYELQPFQELVLDSPNVLEFKERMATLAAIPVEYIDFTMLKGTFPYEMSVLSIHTELDWNTLAITLNDWPYNIYEDGHVFLYRDNREVLKQLTAEERKEISGRESRIAKYNKTNLYSPRKERALKIYLDTSPKKSEESEVD